ncbi:MAG: hypothetical protein Q9166_003094 [cf. Caloplaca sp. 2 TL-2023]
MRFDGSIYSQTLHGITNIKLDELAKKRTSFEQQRHQIIKSVEHAEDAAIKLDILSTGINLSRGHSRLEIDLRNLDRFLVQARYDPSLSSNTLGKWQQMMLRHLNVQSLKFDYASLYGQLTIEWLSAKNKLASATGDEDTEMETFEHVPGGKKLESRLKWEQSVFEPGAVDSAAVAELLHGLFESTPNDSKHVLKALRALREKVEEFERELASMQNFNGDTLEWVIKGLRASDLLDDEKRDALRDLVDNDTILGELADVLNMRMAALDDWSWGGEVLVEERRQLNGSFNIYMQEDLLQAIFLQYIGVRWSVFWKKAFNAFRKSTGVWKSALTSIPTVDRKRRDFYLGHGATSTDYSSVESRRLARYHNGYFLSQLLDAETHEANDEEGEEEADFEGMAVQSAAPRKRTKQRAQAAPRKQLASKAARKAAPSHAGPEDMEDNAQYKPKNAMEAKQNLLHLLSTDILIKTRLHGTVTCFRSQVDSLYPSLPHRTVQRVLEFFGVSSKWLDFFGKFLRAPLRFADDKKAEPRQRQNGTPGSHVLSDVFGEVILFCLDFHVNQETGNLLWRMRDDFWFWSSNHTTCNKAWTSVQRYMDTMGLKLNEARTGAARIAQESKDAHQMVSLDVGETLPEGQIRWGMLYLNPGSGRFEIDQKMVDKHVDELSRQLKDKTGSIITWIQAWNSYATTFFASNFGKPANCFGRDHVNNMLSTHERIQRQIFSSSAGTARSDNPLNGGSVIDFLKQTIKQRFGIENIPDGYFYLPTELGGLEVRNSFIGLLQIRDSVNENPHNLLDKFEGAEKEAYKFAKRQFDIGAVSQHDPKFRPEDPDRFFSFEEFAKYREELWYGYENELEEIYTELLRKKGEDDIETYDNGDIRVALNALSGQNNQRGILSSWYSMSPYWKWVAQLYGPEIIDKFGGLSIVDSGLLPMGMVSLFRSGRVNWQE